MNTRVVKFEEFFKVLDSALSNKADVKKADDHLTLKCGFVVDGADHYLMQIAGLKHAKDAGIDVSNYLGLTE